MQLSGKCAVVTGGGRGIGAAVARALAKAGADVVVASRTKASVETTAKELVALGVRAFPAVVDVASEDSILALEREAKAALGKVDILINNAGIASSAPIKKLELEEWERIIRVNATGVFLCTRAFIGDMAERGWGRVVNVASIASRMGAPYIAAYTASKHAVLGFTRVAAAEYAARNVTVNAVCPGYVDTDMTTQSVSGVAQRSGLDPKAALDAILKTANQRRLVTPEEVAHVVLSLAVDESAGVNGQAIVIDGGGLLA